MTEKIYEVWFEFYDGTQANMDGYHERVKVFANKERAIEERDKLNADNMEKPFYIKEVILDE